MEGSQQTVRRVTEGLMDDEQEDFRVGKGDAYQFFTLKQISEKAQEVLWILEGM